MSVVIRLARAGTKKRPVYHVVVADSRFPRDGRFIERLGHFNPLLPKDNEARLKLDMDKIKAWIAKGAQPSDRVSRFLDAAGVAKRATRNNPEKAVPRKERKANAEASATAATAAQPPPRRQRLPRSKRGQRAAMATQICIARIGAAHGVRGAVKLWTFTEDPLAVRAYGPLATRDGARKFEIASAREAKGHLVATLKGIATREDAERLNGIELYIAREKLPATDDDEYYHADLIGLAAVNAANELIGRVIAIHNFGAGDIIEIAPPQGATMLLPFTNAVVPTVDLKGGRVVIELPEEIDGDTATDADI